MTAVKYEGLKTIFLVMIISQMIGLYVGYQLSPYTQDEGAQSVSVLGGDLSTQVSEDEESTKDTIFIVLLIILMTFFLLFIIICLKKFNIIKLLLLLALALTSLIVFSTFLSIFGSYVFGLEAVLASVVCIIWLKYPKKTSVQNIASIITIAGAAAIIGSSFDVIRILILVSVLSLWDIIAIKSNLLPKLIDSMPEHVPLSISSDMNYDNLTKESSPIDDENTIYSFELGNADVIFPLALSISSLKYGFLTSLLVITFSIAFVFIMFHILIVKKVRVFCALPPACLGAAVGLAIGVVI